MTALDNRPAPDPAAALQELATIEASPDPTLMIIARAGDGTAEVEVTSAQATNRLATALRSVVRDHVDAWTECELIPYGPATQVSDGQLMWVYAREVPMLDIPAVSAAQADLPMFDPTSSFLRRLKLSALRVSTDYGSAVFYRSLSPSQVIGRAKKIPVFRRGDRLDAVSDETLLLDRDVDAVVVGGIVLFDDRRRFQRVFGFLEQLQQRAAATFDTITSGLRISNLEDLKAAATTQIQMLGKLASIERKLHQYPEYQSAITMSNIVAFIEANPHTGVLIAGAGDRAELVFEPDVQHRFKILKLLDDDYLQSQLTTLDYEANSKGLPLT